MWFAIVRNQQVGPLTDAAVVELVRVGAADQNTYVWSKGMADWLPLRQIGKFGSLFDPTSETHSDDDDDDEEDEADTVMMAPEQAQAWAEILNQLPDLASAAPWAKKPEASDSEQPEIVHDVPPMPAHSGDETAQNLPHGLADTALDVPKLASPAPTASQPASSPAIVEEKAVDGYQDPFTAAAAAAAAEATPLPAKERVTTRERPAGLRSIPTVDARPPADASTPHRFSMLWVYLLLPFVGALLTWLIINLLDLGAPTADANGSSTQLPTPGAAALAPDADRPAPNPAAAPADPTAAAAVAPDAAAGAAALTDALTAVDVKPDAPQAAAPPPTSGAAPPSAKADPPPTPRAQARPARPSPSAKRAKAAAAPPRRARLSRADLLAVVNRNRARLSACLVSQPELKGTLSVATTIGRDGSVGAAKVLTARFRDSAAGACVEKTIRGLKFPAFSGEPMKINLPLTL